MTTVEELCYDANVRCVPTPRKTIVCLGRHTRIEDGEKTHLPWTLQSTDDGMHKITSPDGEFLTLPYDQMVELLKEMRLCGMFLLKEEQVRAPSEVAETCGINHVPVDFRGVVLDYSSSDGAQVTLTKELGYYILSNGTTFYYAGEWRIRMILEDFRETGLPHGLGVQDEEGILERGHFALD
jgi:hypothetical protein